MIPFTPNTYIEFQRLKETQRGVKARDEETKTACGLSRAKSCIVGSDAFATPIHPDLCRKETSKHTKLFHASRNGFTRNCYRSVSVPHGSTATSEELQSKDSGFCRSTSMQTCIESRLHTTFTPYSRGTKRDEDERPGNYSSGRAVHQQQGRCRPDDLANRSLAAAASSVMFSDYDNSIRLCQSCNTYFEVSVSSDMVLPYRETDIPTKICNIFWKLSLTLNPFVYGDELVEFESLWPKDPSLSRLLLDCCSVSSALAESLCKFLAVCGPVRVLQAILKQNIVGVDQTFENCSGLLHVACVAKNSEAVSFLVKNGINPSIRNNQGQTAAQVCCSSEVYSLLPGAYLVNSSAPPKVRRTLPTLLEKQKMFEMARNCAEMENLLTKLQNLEFDLNKEMDNTGDSIIHVVVKEGLSQIPLLLLLVKVFRADVNLRNRSGLTCLMLAANMGASVVVDVLLCVLGANPDCACLEKGWTALHYACYEHHLDTVNVLLKRGANFNLEDGDGARPDDIAHRCFAKDCKEVIELKRQQYVQKLKILIKESKLLNAKQLRKMDLFAVNKSGFTLIMYAVKQGSLDTLEFLLSQAENDKGDRPALIDAQHPKTLQTALILAVIHGKCKAAELLLRFGANPCIGDVQKLLPLHHAVLKQDLETVDALLRFNSSLTGLKKALGLTMNDDVISCLKSAYNRRQKYIVIPELFEQSVSGNADRLYCVLEDADNVNPVSGVGDWPMYLAATNGHLDVIKLLVQYNGDFLSIHSSNGNTVLHISCAHNHLEVVECLVSMYRKTKRLSHLLKSHLSLLNFHGRTPLMLAAETGNMLLVRLLLENGASTAVLMPSGQIFRCDQFAGIQYVLEQHHKRHCVQVFEVIGKKNGLKELIDVFQTCHDHNLRDPSSGDSPLMRAAALGKLDVLKFLLQSSSYTLFKQAGISSSSFVRRGQTENGLGFPEDEDDEEDSFDMNDHRRRLAGDDDRQYEDATDAAAADDEGDGNDVHHSNRNNADFDENISALVEGMNTVCRQNPVLIGNRISQTCAINPSDKCTVFHRVVGSADSLVMLDCLLDADQSAVNMQDMHGFSPLHLAVKLNRKKIVQKFAMLPYVDLNCRALDGSLPEDLTDNKPLKLLILQGRSQHEVVRTSRCPLRSVTNSVSGRTRALSQRSSFDFDRLNERYLIFKENLQAQYAQH